MANEKPEIPDDGVIATPPIRPLYPTVADFKAFLDQLPADALLWLEPCGSIEVWDQERNEIAEIEFAYSSWPELVLKNIDST